MLAPLAASASDGASRYLTVFGGRSQLYLGSEDPRRTGGIGLAFGRLEPRLRFRATPGELFVEGYYAHSGTPGASGSGPNETEALGALAYARYRLENGRGWHAYGDLGWGLQYATQTTVDLDSRFNSTPILGIGVAFDTFEGEMSVGLRMLHISNAGLSGRNQGQNQLFVVLGFRY
jgi:hypothetical protein